MWSDRVNNQVSTLQQTKNIFSKDSVKIFETVRTLTEIEKLFLKIIRIYQMTSSFKL